MRGWRLILSGEIVLAQSAWAAVRVMAGYRALELGAEPALIGLVATSLALPALGLALPAGRFTDRHGGTPVIATGLLISTASIALTVLVPLLPVLLVSCVGMGFGYMLSIIGQQSFSAHSSEGRSSDAVFGTLATASSGGQLIGPLLATFIAGQAAGGDMVHPNSAVGFMVCAAFGILAMPAFFVLHPIDRAVQSGRRAIPPPPVAARGVLRTPGIWRALVVSGAVLVSVDLMYTFIPVWATERGIDATIVGALLATRAAVSIVSRFGMATIVGLIGRKAFLIIAISAAIAGLIALPLVGVPAAFIVMIAIGLGLGIPQPLTMSWVASITDASQHGAALGLRITANRLAQVTLPVTIGLVGAPLGVLGVFWLDALLLSASVVLVAKSDPG